MIVAAIARVAVVWDVDIERTLEPEGHHCLVWHHDTPAARRVHGACSRRGTRRRADGRALATASDRADDRAEQRTAANVFGGFVRHLDCDLGARSDARGIRDRRLRSHRPRRRQQEYREARRSNRRDECAAPVSRQHESLQTAESLLKGKLQSAGRQIGGPNSLRIHDLRANLDHWKGRDRQPGQCQNFAANPSSATVRRATSSAASAPSASAAAA